MTGPHIKTLDRIAGHVDTAMKEALLAELLVRRLSRRPEDLDEAQRRAGSASDASKIALDLLQQEGARPDTLPRTPVTGIPLDKLNTPASRVLLAALEAAVKAAEVVDAERGLSVPESDRLGPNDTIGIDLAEQINQICARVSMEVYGAKGNGLE